MVLSTEGVCDEARDIGPLVHVDGVLKLNIVDCFHLSAHPRPIVLSSQQSFTFPTETVNPAGERQTADGQPSEGEGTAGRSAARTEQSGAASAGARMLTSEEAQQAFLSRLLLMLGSFVVLCLVLF